MSFKANSSRPVDIEQNAEQTISFPLFDETGAAVAVDAAATVALLRPDATEAIPSAPVTLDGPTATLVLTGAELTSEKLSAGWQLVWTLFASGGPPVVYKQRALLVRQRLYAVVNNDRLLERHPELDGLYPVGATSWDRLIDSAWDTLNTRLLQTGKRPDLVLSPDSLFEAHLVLSLARVFRALATFEGEGGRYGLNAERYEDQFESEWNRIQLYIDSGAGMPTETPIAAEPVIFLCGRGTDGFYSRDWPR